MLRVAHRAWRIMNFAFSEEQESLRDQVRRLFSTGTQRARAFIDRNDAWDMELWKLATEIGLSGVAISETYGGAGLGAFELCVIAEELGRTLAPLPLLSSVFPATNALMLVGGDESARWLPQIATGHAVGTLALSEGQSGSWDAIPIATVNNNCVSGIKTPVADAAAADFAIVSARADEDGAGYGWWLVPLDDVEVSPLVAIDRVRRFGTLHLRSAPAVRLGAPGQGASLTTILMNHAAVLTAFEQLGGAEAVLAMTVAYALLRRTFGNVIGINQAVKHRLADMYAKTELARGHCYYGAFALSTNSPELSRAAAGARLAATHAFNFAAEESIELHGAIAFTWGHDLSLYLRRSRLLAQQLGNGLRWSDRLVAALSTAVLA
jgi:acyl-CoA dehydrogenase